jgi:hypothetical protein
MCLPSIRVFILFISQVVGSKVDVLLDILPVDPHRLEEDTAQNSAPVTTLQLSLPGGGPKAIDGMPDSVHERLHWVSALRQCLQSTLRALSFPSNSGDRSGLLNVDPESDIHHSLASILNSGLPVPKSPSVQIEEAFQGQTRSTQQEEREERGWWSLRFRQVLYEVQRQELPMNLGVEQTKVAFIT